MANELGWFKFSPLKWMTGRIRKESIKVQIAFVELMCQYWKNKCEMTEAEAELEVGDFLKVLIKKQIVKVDGAKLRIDFLDEQMVLIEDKSEQKRTAALTRWKHKQSTPMHVHTDALQVNNDAMQNDADKIRLDKIRQDKIREELSRAMFSDEQFVEKLNRSHKGKDFKQAWIQCFDYHTVNDNSVFESWEWRKKLLSWLGRMQSNGKEVKNPGKIQ